MPVIVLATSSVLCTFDDLDMCGYRDLSKAGSNWVHSRKSRYTFGMYGYLRTTHAHKRKIILDASDDDKRMINENG